MANLLKNDGTSASFAEGASTEQVMEGVGMSIDALAGGVGAGIQIGQNLKQASEIDRRGNAAGKKDYMGNTMAAAKAGGEIGSLFGPVGTVIGLAGGALAGAGATALGGEPELDDMVKRRKQFQLETSMKGIKMEDTFTKQQLAARDGMDVQNSQDIEVERDEIVLRKFGKAFKKVADFKGGKTHENGGEQYEAQEGDIIIPGNKRATVNRMLKHRRYSAIESLRTKLPTDTGQREFEDGTKGIKNNPNPSWKKEALRAIEEVYPNASKQTKQSLLANIAHETAKGTYSSEVPLKWKNIEGRKDLRSIRRRVTSYMAEHGITKEDYDKLPAADRLSIQYQGTTGHSLSGGIGALQTTDVAGNKVELMRKVGKSLGLENDAAIKEYVDKDIYQSSLYSLKVLKDSGVTSEQLNKTSGALDLRKKFINPGETNKKHLDSVVMQEKDIVKNFPIGVTKKLNTPPTIEDVIGPKETYTQEDNAKYEEALTKFNSKFENKSRVEQEAILTKEEAAEQDLINNPEKRGYYHTGDAKSKTIQAAQAIGAIDVMGTNPLGQWLANKANVGQRLAGQEIDQVGFSNPALRDQMDNMMSYLQKGSVTNPLKGKKGVQGQDLSKVKGLDETWLMGDVMRTWSAAVSKGVTGESFDAGIPNALAEIMDGASPETLNTWIVGAKKAGIIDASGEYMIRDIYNNPSKFWTSNMTTGLVADMSTIIANPKALLTMGKGALKLFKPANWKAALKAAKKLPGGARTLYKNTKEYLQTAKVKDVANLDDYLDAAKHADELGAEVAKAQKISYTESFTSTIRDAKDLISKFPDAMRKRITGKSFSEIKALKKEVEAATGLNSAQLSNMSKAEIGKVMQTKLDDAAKAVEISIQEKDAAWKLYKGAKGNLDGYKAQLAALKKAGVNTDQDKIHAVEALVEEATTALAREKSVLQQTYATQELNNQRWNRIGQLEGLADTPEYNTKFRTLVKMEAAIGRHTDEIAKSGNIEGEIANLLERQKAFSKTISEGVTQLGKDTKAAKVSKIIENATTAQKDLLDKGRKANLNIGHKKGVEARLRTQLEKFPNAWDALKKDAEFVRNLEKGIVDSQRVMEALTSSGSSPEDVENIKSEILKNFKPGDLTPEETPKDGGETTTTKPKVEGVDGRAAGADIEGLVKSVDKVTPKQGLVEKKEEYKPGDNKPKIGKVVGEALSSLASYAPAFYNIAKGLEPAEKVERKFVAPQIKEYENMSQAQINAIDDAFNTAVGNARNTSGGMMSNFRSNTEKAWADKLKREAQVRTGETQRADAIASENINTLNQAEMYNQQVASKADIMDMQSKAAKGSFLAQGMQDIANIGARNKKDRQLNKNQQMVMNMMGQGTNFSVSPDGTINFTGSNVPKKNNTPTNTKTGTVSGRSTGTIGGTPQPDSVYEMPTFDFQDPSAEGYVQ